MSEQRPAFQQLQYRFAAHLRDPGSNPAPPGIEERRLEIYRGLFYRNIENFIATGFPVLRTLYSEADWQALIRQFYATHVSHSPQFYQIAEEFIHYLQNEHTPRDCDEPFMLELAHYEWIEMILAIDPREAKGVYVDEHAELMDAAPVLNPCLHNLAYHYPVHRISADYRPGEPGEQATHLVVYRKPDDSVAFLEINPVTARLLQRLAQAPGQSGRAHLLALAEETGLAAETVLDFGQQTLEDLFEKAVILGTRAVC